MSAKFTTSYLHYNMFLFKCAFNGTITDKRFNLHYSMFLFKYITFYKLAQLLEIYITVCFYLNEISAIEKVKDFYLHYSMFLFKRWVFFIKLENKLKIYITVCFYLNSSCFYSMYYLTNLHYSMFLFKPSRISTGGGTTITLFTLQYVSI